LRWRKQVGQSAAMGDAELAAVSASPQLGQLPEAARRALAAAAGERAGGRGDRLFHQGDPASHLFLVTAGRVKLTQVGPDGQEVIVRHIGPGEILGGIALVEGAAYPVSGEVLEPARLLAWPRGELRRLAEEHPRLALLTTGIIAGRMHELQERFRELATQRVAQRLARALLRLVRQAGRRTAEGVEIDLPLSRQDLAEMTGTTLYTVSRTLSAWESAGVVAVGREKVVVVHPHRLVEIAEDLER
jgi:CRP-like cAMP-binding protein